MTVVDAYMGQGPFKDEFHPMMGYQHFAPPHPTSKFTNKPIEDYPFFAAIVCQKDGSFQLRSSRELDHLKEHILEEAVGKLREYVDDIIDTAEPSRRNLGPKRSPASTAIRGNRLVPYSNKPGHRHHHGWYNTSEQRSFQRSDRKVETRQLNRGERQIQIQVNDTETQKKWFSDAFKAVQQVGCRTIAKVWIKKIHPKKQSTHPYNGGVPKHEQHDPNRTRPPYWPPHVIHKEPDHIDRAARTELLVHLIMNTPQRQIKPHQDPTETLINAQDLLTALDEKKNDFKADRWAIIGEIVRAREQIELYETGGFDDDAVIHVPDFSETARNARGESDGDGEDSDVPGSVDKSETDNKIRTNSIDSTHVPSNPEPPTELTTSFSSQTSCAQSIQPEDIRRNQCDQLTPRHDLELDQSSKPEMPLLHSSLHSMGNNHQPATEVMSLQRFHPQRGLHSLETQLDHQREDTLMSLWPPSASPADFLTANYSTDNMQTQNSISGQTYRLGEIALLQNHRQDINVPTNHGMPMFVPCQDFVGDVSRPLSSQMLRVPGSNQPFVTRTADCTYVQFRDH